MSHHLRKMGGSDSQDQPKRSDTEGDGQDLGGKVVLEE